MAKPASKPDWTVGNPNFGLVTIEPSVQKKIDGWFADERPPHEFFNWLFFNIDEWIDYFDLQVDALLLQLGNFDAVVGFGGTHADINDLMADPNIANLKNILVTQSIASPAIQVIDQDFMNFYFKPQASVIKNGSVKGILVDANNTRLIYPRFQGYNAGGDFALEIAAGKKNNLTTGPMFLDNDTNYNDLGDNNTISDPIDEE